MLFFNRAKTSCLVNPIVISSLYYANKYYFLGGSMTTPSISRNSASGPGGAYIASSRIGSLPT